LAHPHICPHSLHDALPICSDPPGRPPRGVPRVSRRSEHPCDMSRPCAKLRACSASSTCPPTWRASSSSCCSPGPTRSTCCPWPRSEEHTSELQSRENLVCR